MTTTVKVGMSTARQPASRAEEPAFYSITALASRWCCSRATVYNLIRGEKVIDFAPGPGRKGHKLVPADVVRRIEQERMRVFR